MQFAWFRGCKIPFYMSHYETASRAVLDKMGVGLVDMEFGCCGYPARNQDAVAHLVSAARNLAMAEQAGLDLLTPCKCCFGSFKHAIHALAEDQGLLAKVNAVLADEGLRYQAKANVRHILQVLHDEVGLKALKDKITRRFGGLKVAVHYGCHALRPSAVTQFDDPFGPKLFDELVELTGAKSVAWGRKLDCCGAPLWEKNDELGRKIAKMKIDSGHQAGAAIICSACTYCQIQFDTIQAQMLQDDKELDALPSLLYPQLLGLALGLPEDKLGLQANAVAGAWVANHME